jgi:hypothetical protein
MIPSYQQQSMKRPAPPRKEACALASARVIRAVPRSFGQYQLREQWSISSPSKELPKEKARVIPSHQTPFLATKKKNRC